MKIAICDDDIRFAGKIEQLVKNSITIPAECDVFLSAEELLTSIEKTEDRYQLYILDIEMQEINGMEAAARIRTKDQNALLIFMTSHVEKMPEAFDVNAFHYLIKPIDERKAREVIQRAVQKLNIDRKFFTFQTGRENHVLGYEEILFFERLGRKVQIHTKESSFEYYGTLKEVLKTLAGGHFVQIHQAYIVNLDHVTALDREQVSLRDDSALPISRTYRKELLNAYQNYILENL